MNDADVAASMARTFLVEHAGDLSALESAAIGRYLISREKEVARLRRTIAVPWRGVAGIGFRRALGRVVVDASSVSPSGRASRARAPAAGRARRPRHGPTTRIAPSRMPASETRGSGPSP